MVSRFNFSTLYNSLFLSIHPKKRHYLSQKEGGIIIKVYMEYIVVVVVVASRFFGWLVGWLVVDSVVFHVNGGDVMSMSMSMSIYLIPSIPSFVVIKPHVRYNPPIPVIPSQ